ncbi:MAG: hypothetical protein GX224_00290 [Thermoplasmatales archaeon]|nr:hypothetical protein [Thermoplasmatales archaeon]
MGLGRKAPVIAAVAILLVSGAAAYVVVGGGSHEKQGGLYGLGATVIEVEMGGVTATPEIVYTIEALYEKVYGKLPDTEYTLDQAKADTAFWDAYCKYDPMAVDNGNGTFTVDSKTGRGSKQVTTKVTIGKVDCIISTGTMYMTTIYNLLCEKHGVEPHSQAAENSAALKGDFRKLIAGGTTLDYVEGNTNLIGYFDKSVYKDGGANTMGNYDKERMGQNIRDVLELHPGSKVVVMGSGSHSDQKFFTDTKGLVEENGGEGLLFVAGSSINDAFANIEGLGMITGLFEYSESLLKELQVRLYAVYKALQAKADETHKVYWEASNGKAVRGTGTSAAVMEFLGWDTSLLDGAECDLEKIIGEKPDIIIFYSNDPRSEAVKMRVAG